MNKKEIEEIKQLITSHKRTFGSFGFTVEGMSEEILLWGNEIDRYFSTTSYGNVILHHKEDISKHDKLKSDLDKINNAYNDIWVYNYIPVDKIISVKFYVSKGFSQI